MKKIISILLTFILLFGINVISANADTNKNYWTISLTDEATFQYIMGNVEYTPESFQELKVMEFTLTNEYNCWFGRTEFRLLIEKDDNEKSISQRLYEREDISSAYGPRHSSCAVVPQYRHISMKPGENRFFGDYEEKWESENWVCEDRGAFTFENGIIIGKEYGYGYLKKIDKNGNVCFTYKITVDPRVVEHHHHTDRIETKDATYFRKGYSGDFLCKVCGEITEKGKYIAKLKLNTPKAIIKGDKNKIAVKYKIVTDATGFQVKYKLGKKSVTKTYNTKKTVTKTFKNLKKGTYKVYVRAFIKQGKNKAYSSWSKAKKVKVK